MSVDIPNPFNYLDDNIDTDSWENSSYRVTSPTNIQFKANGGLRLDDKGLQTRLNSTSVQEGFGCDLNVTGATETDWESGDFIFVYSQTYNAQNRVQLATLANKGATFRLSHGSSTNELNHYAEWTIHGQDSLRVQFLSNSHQCVVIDPQSTPDITVGTYAANSLKVYSIVCQSAQIAGTSDTWVYISRVVKMSTQKSSTQIPRLYGASVKLKDLYTEVEQFDYLTRNHNYTEKLGSSYLYACPFVIGKSGSATSFDDEGLSYISPESASPTDPRFHLSLKAMRVYLDLQSGDTAVFSGSYSWGTKAVWDFDTIESTTFNSPTFKGMGRITIGSGVAGPASFVDTDILLDKDGTWDLEGSSLTNPGTANQLMEIG